MGSYGLTKVLQYWSLYNTAYRLLYGPIVLLFTILLCIACEEREEKRKRRTSLGQGAMCYIAKPG